MNNEIPPWVSRKSDFSKPGWHTDEAAAYWLMFEYLRLSPSYELARKHNNEGLTAEDEEQLPSDFDSVLNTYKLLGDVQKIFFRDWWLERGLSVFGNPYSKPKIHNIGVLAEGKRYGVDVVASAIESYMKKSREPQGLRRSVLLSIPLTMKRSEMRKQLEQLLDRIGQKSSQNTLKPQIKIEGKRLRAKTLQAGLRLLWIRAAKPRWELWRLGAHSRLSVTYSPVLRVGNPRKVSDTVESVDREMMTKMTSRALKKYEAIAENAARGRFPTQAKVEIVPFNYAKLAKMIRARNTWEKSRKEDYEYDDKLHGEASIS